MDAESFWEAAVFWNLISQSSEPTHSKLVPLPVNAALVPDEDRNDFCCLFQCCGFHLYHNYRYSNYWNTEMQNLLLLNSSAVDSSDGNKSLYSPAYIGLTDLRQKIENMIYLK